MSAPGPAPNALPEPDVARALETLGLRASHWQPITTLGGGTQRISYRVVLHDGRVVKVRRVLDDPRSSRTARIRRALTLPGIVPLLACCGPVWVEGWVEGRVLRPEPIDPSQLQQAAVLLASVHAAKSPDDEPCGETCGTGEVRALSERRLDELRRTEAIEAGEVDALRWALREGDPGRADCGLVHGDLVPDNLIVDAGGALHLIDNEEIGWGPFDLDLATTALRWPLAPAPLAAFLAAYAGHARRHPEALSWWRLVAALKSAAVRVAHYPASAAPALARVRRIARTLQRENAKEGR